MLTDSSAASESGKDNTVTMAPSVTECQNGHTTVDVPRMEHYGMSKSRGFLPPEACIPGPSPPRPRSLGARCTFWRQCMHLDLKTIPFCSLHSPDINALATRSWA